MTSLAKLILLAGAAFAPGAIFAQTVAPPVAWEDVPQASIGAAPQAGVTWQRPASPPAFRAAPAMPAPLPAPEVVPQQDVQLAMARRGGVRGGVQVRGGVSSRGGMHVRGGTHFGGRHNFQRMHKGSRLHSFWFGPRFRLNNWAAYGFAPPRPGWFWIRYYDDALLLDGGGVVRDYRSNMDWDRYGERWEYDSYGVPGYGGAHGGGYAYAGQPGAYPWGYTITETTTVTTGGGRATTVTRRTGGKPHHVRRTYNEHEPYGRYQDDRDESWSADAYADDYGDSYRDDYRDGHRDDYRDDFRDDYRDHYPMDDYREEDFGAPYDDLPPPPSPPEPIPQGELG